jgi:hypothetical protein
MMYLSVAERTAVINAGIKRGGVQFTPTATTLGMSFSQAAQSAMGVPSLM